MANIKSYKEFDIWKKSMNLATEIYKLVESTPKLKKDYGLSDQLRRSAVSISSNIAEGFDRNNNNEFIRFLLIARGSAGELNSQVLLVFRVGWIDSTSYKNLNNRLEILRKQITSLISYLKKHRAEKKNQTTK